MLNSQNSRRDLNLQENSQENSSAASTYYESFASSTNENENHLYENVVWALKKPFWNHFWKIKHFLQNSHTVVSSLGLKK